MLKDFLRPTSDSAYVIVIGNEKGGAGKTTTAMHVIASLLQLGFKVGSLDVDSRQRSLSRYLENRQQTIQRQNIALEMPEHHILMTSQAIDSKLAAEEERQQFEEIFHALKSSKDFIVIDTPGSHNFLSRIAHSYADTIITPINDSFLDLDVLAKIESETHKIISPGIYSEMIWSQKMERAKRDKGTINWIVMRNRLSSIDAKNKRHMAEILDKLSQRIAFRHAPGFSERVIFRELFLLGMTLLDLKHTNSPISFSMSHVAARQELRELLSFLEIPVLQQSLNASTLSTQKQETMSA